MAQRPRHRHFVILPVFLGLLGLSLLSAFFGTSALTASVTQNRDIVSLSGGMQLIAGEGSAVDTSGAVPTIREGSVLVRSAGIAQVHTALCDVLGLASTFHVVAGHDTVTVSAITTPVLVSVEGRRALVPTGMQLQVTGDLPGIALGYVAWRSKRVAAPLPEHFLRDQLLAFRDVPEAESALPPSVAKFPPDDPTLPSVQFPATQERAREEWRTEVLGVLRSRIDQDDASGARAMLEHPAFRPAFADAQSLSTLVTLAGRAPEGAAGLKPLLLAFLSDRHDLWLLAAVHPAFSAAAWSMGIPALSPEEGALLAFGLPEADRRSEGLSPVVVQWWEDFVTARIAGEQDPRSLVEPLLTAELPLIEEHQKSGAPERAQVLAHALLAFAEPVVTALPKILQKSLAAAEALTDQTFTVFPASNSSFSVSSVAAKESSSSSSAAALRPIAAEERVAAIEQALSEAGALFTIQAKITSLDDGQSVHVSGILFSSSQVDRAYEFDVDVGDNQVSHIVQDGKEMPYPMALEAFLEWVRK